MSGGKLDAACAAAADLARAAAVESGGDTVGQHLDVRAEAERVATHAFAATVPGYVGWYWAVTVARAPRAKTVTVDEVVLLPGDGALLAPPWVPWSERLRPGDLSPGDLVPVIADDPRLVPAYVYSDDPAVEEVAFELGLGRVHVLSREARLDAADRWNAGDRGPRTADGPQRPSALRDVRLLPATRGFAARGVRRLRQRDHRIGRPGRHRRLRLWRSFGGRRRAPPLAEPVGEIYDDGVVFERP